VGRVAVYAGQEDISFFRRTPAALTASVGKELRIGDVLLLGAEAIHAVANPLDSVTAAIHVNGGDSFSTPRSEWDPGTGEERP
jgi:predicted metal-dependent enzyme (double-stranded beta helix superfamily)